MPKPPSKVAVYLSVAIDASPKLQAEIAAEAGFTQPNIISMLKTGITKLPITRIPALAKAIDRDPVELFRLAMDEYMPDMLNVVDAIYNRDQLNAGETAVLQHLRAITGGKSFRMDANAKSLLDEFCSTLR